MMTLEQLYQQYQYAHDHELRIAKTIKATKTAPIGSFWIDGNIEHPRLVLIPGSDKP